MDKEQSEETQTSDKTECLSEPESSPYSPKTDRQRAKSLPVDLYQHESSSHKEHPVRGKRVQFADMMGLNLANVRHFDISDVANETSGLQNHPPNQQLQHLNSARLAPAFEMPVSSLEFDMKSRRLGVALESVTITASEVKGVIRVMQSNAREAGVRYTLNNWLTFSDIQAALRLKNEEKGLEWEKFDFVLHTPFCFDKDSSVHFAVYCQTDHGKYWDNNDGQNYTLRIQTHYT
ncbi:protein phosphatase 1 regulatory subunit 3G-like [Sinocyclocheilus anshuiensis]|uniref:Protein phosphatase 1 regulatory subunit 3G-like n=1 Tax=Sinocyclocheilus anshuiensis TaxID=1608454 RepID=A0A671NKT4_9TELE|nr:PREDICTED: protein phosphatase 1 regulatory subunit 3G-like [Sinocyclocheilus anshuiensis]